MYQINHTRGNVRFYVSDYPTEKALQEAILKEANKYKKVMITRKKNDWMLWKDLSEDKRDDFYFTQRCKPLPISNNQVELKDSAMGFYYQGEGEGIAWTKEGFLLGFTYDRTVRTIKGALKLQCKFNKERIILCQ